MASTGNNRISPIGWLGAILIAVFGVALCTGNHGKNEPTPSPSVSTTDHPLQTAVQP